MHVWSLGWEDALEKEMATHSSILAWKIPWTEEPGGLWSTESHRVGHDWSDLTQHNPGDAQPPPRVARRTGTKSKWRPHLTLPTPGGNTTPPHNTHTHSSLKWRLNQSTVPGHPPLTVLLQIQKFFESCSWITAFIISFLFPAVSSELGGMPGTQ